MCLAIGSSCTARTLAAQSLGASYHRRSVLTLHFFRRLQCDTLSLDGRALIVFVLREIVAGLKVVIQLRKSDCSERKLLQRKDWRSCAEWTSVAEFR